MTCSRQSGFTLIEMLVVVFLIALITGIGVLSLSTVDSGRLLKDETLRLKIMMDLAAQEAVIFGSPIGVVFQSGSYDFVISGEKDWVKIRQHNQLTKHVLKPIFNIQVIEGAVASMTKDKNQALQPQVIFFPTGLITSFKVNFIVQNDPGTLTYQLSLLENGSIGREPVEG